MKGYLWDQINPDAASAQGRVFDLLDDKILLNVEVLYGDMVYRSFNLSMLIAMWSLK